MAYQLKTIDHIGFVVRDFDAAQEFFTDLGFKAGQAWTGEGDLLNKVTGVPGSKTEVVFMEAPNGQLKIELTKFVVPDPQVGTEPLQMNSTGLQHFAMMVEDIETIAEILKQKDWQFITDIEQHEDVMKVVYVRGPEGVVFELAESLK